MAQGREDMAGVLKISEAASLACHAMAVLAASRGRVCTTGAIASCLSASADHLSKVLQRLAKLAFVRSIRGREGGFTITSSGESATLLQIIEGIDGPFTVRECVIAVPACGAGDCIIKQLGEAVTARVVETLGQAKVADIKPPDAGLREDVSEAHQD